MIKPMKILLSAFILLLTGQAGAVQNEQTRTLLRPAAAALFEEDILASNAAAVRARAAEFPEEMRFDRLLNWVLPSGSHISIRMTGDFTQTNPAPVNRIDDTAEHRIGGGIISPVFDLLDLAERLDRRIELLARVDAIPEPAAEEQRRAKAALQLLLHLETENTDTAVEAIDRLSQLVRTSNAIELSEMWPETLVVYRCVVRKVKAPGIDDLLAFLFSQRTLQDVPKNALVWHSQIGALAGQNGHRETVMPSDAAGADSELTQWIPISLRRAQTRGQCLAAVRWARVGYQIEKISGHNDDYLFFRSPLAGNYEVQCDLSASTTQAMTAGTFLGNDGVGPHLWVGTFRDSAKRIESPLKFSGLDEWIRYGSVVRNGVCTSTLNGLTAHVEQAATQPDPWFAVRNWWRMHAAARDIRISGNPVIPESIDLSTAKDLRGWYAYFEESVGRTKAVWEHSPDESSVGQILGRGGAPAGSFCESLLAYQRPLDSVASIQYEFFYEPGRTEVHPALDRMVFCLQPDGVRIHWLTDGLFDSTDLGPENLSQPLSEEYSVSPLPLIQGKWNELTIAVNAQQVTLHLNGQPICKTEIDTSNDRVFGLFHFADQTEARVRNVVMRGNWPRTLPEPSEQELADSRPAMLDADFAKLEDVFTHDFSTGGIAERYFTPVQIQPAGTVALQQDGLLIRRPGGGPWFDTHVNLPFMIHGDFEIEVSFDEFKALGNEFGCIMVVVQLDDDKQQQCRILRTRDELQRQELHSSLSEIHADGGRFYSASMPKKTEAIRGRLRMARRGTTLYYLFAENDSSVFRILDTEQISNRPSVADGLHFHTMCNGKGETSAVWKSFTLRAERLTLKPNPEAKSQTNLYAMDADGSNIRLLAEPQPGFTQLGSFEWSADGRQLIGDMSKGGVETSRILLMNSDGSNQKDLGSGCMPCLSGDATEVVFSQPSMGVMKMKSDGTNRELIEKNAWGIQWSPDGRTIAFASGSNITLLDVESKKKRSLLSSDQASMFSTIFWNFGWSGDSRSVGFKVTLPSGESAVFVTDVENPKSLLQVYSSLEYFPEDISLNPDATSVMFPAFTPERSRASLMIATRKSEPPSFPYIAQFGAMNITGADWSPDGKTIVFTSAFPPAPIEWP